MSEFQTGLLVIGALVVAGVFGYNKWQEHRAGKVADLAFRSEHPDLLDDEAGRNPRAGEDIHDGSLLLHPQAPLAPRKVLDKRDAPLAAERFDYIVELDGEAQAAALRDHWGAIENRFARRVTISSWSDGQWVPVPLTGSCLRLRAALQLVSRRGVVSESELLEFRSEVETLGARLGLSATSPEMKDALDAARVLDTACADADIQIAFHVVAIAGAPFAGTKLRAAAEAAGFQLDGEGRFSLRDHFDRELYSLSDRSGARFSPAGMKDAAPLALTLSMDVPTTPDTQRTFDGMVRFAKTLAGLLGGTLVDDNNQLLDDRSVAAIDSQLTLVRQNLESRGIVPGGALALRLFS